MHEKEYHREIPINPGKYSSIARETLDQIQADWPITLRVGPILLFFFVFNLATFSFAF